MRLGFAILAGTLLIAIPATSRAQQPETFTSTGQLLQILTRGRGRERAQVDNALHLRFQANQTCTAKTLRGYLEQGRMGAVMQVSCDAGDRLVVLGRLSSGRWQYVGSVTLSDEGGPTPTVHVEAVTCPPFKDIIVHNNQVLGGTGIWQGDLMIFKVIRGRLRKVLDTVEYSYVQRWTKPFLSVKEESKFVIDPTTKKQPAEVDQTMHLTTNSTTVVLSRSFQWSQETDTFDVGLWFPVIAAAKPAAH